MNIATENLNKVKKAFENKIVYGEMKIDSDYPFFNAYMNKGEIIFSEGYPTYYQASGGACQEYHKEYLDRRNGGEFQIPYLGTLNTSRFFLEK